ncbi:MAG: hypothetical protein ABJE47_04265 [bacterium]
MTARLLSIRPHFLVLGVAVLIAAPLRAQDASQNQPQTPTSIVADSGATVTAAPVGPTVTAAAVGVRHASPSQEMSAAAPKSGGYGQSVSLMVVGGAAVLTGLIIGNSAGYAISVGGAVVGLIGLYQYLQ